MPVIRQERGVKTVAGLPVRWGRRAYAELSAAMAGPEGARSQAYKDLAKLIDEVTAAPVPIDATDARLCIMAERFAADCASVPVAEKLQADQVRERMAQICRIRGLVPPTGDDDQAMRRMVDGAWWRRGLRRLHGRVFEHAAMRLGFVSVRAGSYCSNETVKRRREQVERNQAALQAVTMKNDQGQEFTLADLAAKGMGNKSNRKGELMLRMAGCEDVARELGHVGLFVTLTCPSKFHPVLAKVGKINPNYQGATPRQAQEYLNSVWARTRAQNARDGIAPYGFRIAEPHHDGCPHWHMLVFVPRSQVAGFSRNLWAYALAEDGTEPGAQANRLKIVEIDPNKGTAAGYIAKYVGKNIDDSQGAAYDEEGEVKTDLTGEELTAPCQRVDAWAAVWGIRQFQGLGMPPVTVWRELRRVANLGDDAPEYLRQALKACQRIESKFIDAETGKPGVIHAANFGNYIRAQGGINQGRDYRIGIAQEFGVIEGRYGPVERQTPVGVYARPVPLATVYPSTRYTWTRSGVAVAVRRSWSPLNNCTPLPVGRHAVGPHVPVWWLDGAPEMQEFDDSEWFAGQEFEKFFVPPDEVAAEWLEQEQIANEIRINTVWTVPVRFNQGGM